jgi:hypothetical protein
VREPPSPCTLARACVARTLTSRLSLSPYSLSLHLVVAFSALLCAKVHALRRLNATRQNVRRATANRPTASAAAPPAALARNEAKWSALVTTASFLGPWFSISLFVYFSSSSYVLYSRSTTLRRLLPPRPGHWPRSVCPTLPALNSWPRRCRTALAAPNCTCAPASVPRRRRTLTPLLMQTRPMRRTLPLRRRVQQGGERTVCKCGNPRSCAQPSPPVQRPRPVAQAY